jgi:hypothetical protein
MLLRCLVVSPMLRLRFRHFATPRHAAITLILATNRNATQPVEMSARAHFAASHVRHYYAVFRDASCLPAHYLCPFRRFSLFSPFAVFIFRYIFATIIDDAAIDTPPPIIFRRRRFPSFRRRHRPFFFHFAISRPQAVFQRARLPPRQYC